MTTLIYRGFAHSPFRAARPAGPRDLIYRGHRHDGTTIAVPARDCRMRYRGAAYLLRPSHPE
jgi:hypothetical protein